MFCLIKVAIRRITASSETSCMIWNTNVFSMPLTFKVQEWPNGGKMPRPFGALLLNMERKLPFTIGMIVNFRGQPWRIPKTVVPMRLLPITRILLKAKLLESLMKVYVKYIYTFSFMSLVAHRFGRVEFRLSNICFDFFKCVCLKKTTTKIFEIRHVQIDELPRT